MPKKSMLFIYNPKAGKALIRNKLADILDIFAKADYEITIYPTRFAGDAKQFVEGLERSFDLLVCSGGDGTLDEVVTGMIAGEKEIPIGYIPAGSTNDFANSLGISKNMQQAAKTLIAGQNFPCDIGSFNQDIFVYIAAFGLFTDVSYETKQETKNVLGHMAYLLEGVKRISAIKSYRMKVCFDGNELIDDFMYGMITNSISVGGFKRITGKNVKLDDGVFEVTLIKKPQNPYELNQIMAALVDRTIDTDCMYCFCTSHIELYSEKPLAWTLDGEFGGEHRKVKIKNMKQAIQVRIP